MTAIPSIEIFDVTEDPKYEQFHYWCIFHTKKEIPRSAIAREHNFIIIFHTNRTQNGVYFEIRLLRLTFPSAIENENKNFLMPFKRELYVYMRDCPYGLSFEEK